MSFAEIFVEFFKELGVLSGNSLISQFTDNFAGNSYDRAITTLQFEIRRLRGTLVSRNTIRISRDQIDAFNIQHYFEQLVNSIYNDQKFPNANSLNNYHIAVNNWYQSNFRYGGSGFSRHSRTFQSAVRANEQGDDGPINNLLIETIDSINALSRFQTYIRTVFWSRVNRGSVIRLENYADELCKVIAVPFAQLGPFLQRLGLRTPDPETVSALYDIGLDVKNSLRSLIDNIIFVEEKIAHALENLNTRVRTLENIINQGR